MIYAFNARNGHILVRTKIFGPLKYHVFYLALDTGATDTMVSAELLTDIGYDLTQHPFVSVTTGSGIVQVPDLKVARLEALGHDRVNFPVLVTAFWVSTFCAVTFSTLTFAWANFRWPD